MTADLFKNCLIYSLFLRIYEEFSTSSCILVYYYKTNRREFQEHTLNFKNNIIQIFRLFREKSYVNVWFVHIKWENAHTSLLINRPKPIPDSVSAIFRGEDTLFVRGIFLFGRRFIATAKNTVFRAEITSTRRRVFQRWMSIICVKMNRECARGSLHIIN